MIASCAVLADAEGPTAIAQWTKPNEAWLYRHLARPGVILLKRRFQRGRVADNTNLAMVEYHTLHGSPRHARTSFSRIPHLYITP
ncbi:MAG: hypothetical protein KBE65_13280 [Phycisphaerae bacterium]|nr:hypothetical protein [Phycisphaerae bacterium]